jgi:Fe-S cluster assembly iron-binding protein IscA
MLTVTDAATERIAQLLDDQGVPDETAVRLVYHQQGIALQQDTEREGDTTFEHEGRTVLLLDNEVANLLSEGTLDVDGENLTLRHPKDEEEE